MVLLLHALHSRAIHQQLSAEQQAQQAQQELLLADAVAAEVQAQAAMQAAVLQAAAGLGRRGGMLSHQAAASSHTYSSSHAHARGHGDSQGYAPSHTSQRLRQQHPRPHQGLFPRLHLRRRLTLLLLTQRVLGSGRDGGNGSAGGGRNGQPEEASGSTPTTATAEGWVFEEWEVSLDKR